MATISQVQEVVYRARFEDQASAGAAAAAKAVDGYNAALEVVDQTVTRSARSATSLIGQYDQQTKAAKALETAKRNLAAAENALAVETATGGSKQEALARTVDVLRDKVAAGSKALGDGTEAVKRAGDAHGDASNKVGLFGLSVQKTGFLLHDATKAIESLVLGMSPLQVAMQHVGQVQGLFGDLGTAVKAFASSFLSVPGALLAATAAIVGFGVAAEHESTRLGNLRQQLRATHDDYASLATAVDAAAKQAAASTSLSTAQAREAAQTIASAKYFSGTTQDLVELTKASQNLARVWNVDVGEASKFLRGAIDDPAKAAKELADKGFPGMSGALAESLGRMQAAGQGGKVLDEVLRVLFQRTAKSAEDTSPLKTALHDLEQTFYTASTGGKSLATTLGDFVNLQAARVVIGLNDVIHAIERATTAAQKSSDAVRQAYPNGINPETGAPNPVLPMPTATGAVTGGSALSQVDPSIRQFVDAAAKQYQIDTEILARLQLSENRAPAGVDLGGSPVWATSSTGAVGPMQVLRSTFGGIPGFAGQNIQNPQTNVNAGAAYFAQMLDRYGDVRLAVLAFHDGPGLMDQVLAGGGNVSNSQSAIAQALKVTQGYTGTGRALVSAGPAFPGESLTAPNALVGGGGLALSAGIRDQNRPILEDAQKAAAGLGLIAESRDKLIAQQHLFEEALKISDQTPGQLDTWQKALDRVKGELNDSLTPAQAYVRSLTDQLPAAVALTEGDKRLAEVQKALADQERSQPGSVTPEIRAQALAAALDLQSAAYKKQVFDVETSISAQDKITAAYGQGYAAVAHATAQTQAYNEAIKLFPRGSEEARNAAAGLTQEYERQAQAARNTQIAASTLSNKDQLQFLQAETASLGQNDDARTAMLNHLKAEQELKKQGVDIESALGKAYLNSVDALSSQTAAFQQQQGALNELKGFFDNTFSTISNAITSAFATGNLAALKFKDIAHSVASAVISEFAKLAVLNPLRNWLFGENQQTLSTVGGFIGNLFGGGTSNAGLPAGEVGLTSTASGVSALEGLGLVTPLSGSSPAQLAAANNASTSTSILGSGGILGGVGALGTLANLGDKLGLTGGGGGIIASIGDKIVTGITNALGNTTTATEIAAQAGGGSLARLAAGVSDAVGASTETATAVASAASTVSQALPYIGAAISVITELATGNIRGAGLVAGGALAGAAIGSVIPVIGTAVGTAVGAVIGGLADTFFPAHPLHPFDASSLDVQGGRLIRGKTLSQAETAQAGSVVDLFATNMNTALDRLGLVLTNLDGTIGAVGNGIQGLVTVSNPAELFNRLQFANAPGDTSQFGVAKGALAGMSFATPQALTDELAKIAGFADATAAIGIQLKSVGTDLTNIQIASVSGADQGNNLRTALQHDLTTQTFANVAALDAEINKVNQFVSGTIPGLLHPVEQTTSAIADQSAKVIGTYQDAIAQSLQYGIDNTAVLQDAEAQALLIVRRAGIEQIQATATQLSDRLKAASTGGLAGAADQAMHAFAANAQQQREALSKLWTDTYGDSIKTSRGYLQALADLETTLGAERVAAARATAAQIATSQRSLDNTTASIAARQAALRGDTSAVPLADFDQKAMAERIAYKQQLLAQFGDFYIWTEDYATRITDLEKVQQGERLKIVQQFGTAINTATADQLKAAQGSVATLFTSLSDYVIKLQTGTNSPLSPTAQYDLAKAQFNAVAGAAAAGDAASAGKLTGFADTFLNASRAVSGSGVGYAADFSRVLDAIQNVVQAPVEQLTNSFVALQLQQQTVSIVDAVNSVQAEVAALRTQMQLTLARMAQAA